MVPTSKSVMKDLNTINTLVSKLYVTVFEDDEMIDAVATQDMRPLILNMMSQLEDMEGLLEYSDLTKNSN